MLHSQHVCTLSFFCVMLKCITNMKSLNGCIFFFSPVVLKATKFLTNQPKKKLNHCDDKMYCWNVVCGTKWCFWFVVKHFEAMCVCTYLFAIGHKTSISYIHFELERFAHAWMRFATAFTETDDSITYISTSCQTVLKT